MTAPSVAPHTTRSANPDDVDHLYCCDPNLSMCGLDLTGVPEGPEFDAVCPLCGLAGDTRQGCPEPGCPNRAVNP